MPPARSELHYAPDMNRKATWQVVSFWPRGDVGCGWTAAWRGCSWKSARSLGKEWMACYSNCGPQTSNIPDSGTARETRKKRRILVCPPRPINGIPGGPTHTRNLNKLRCTGLGESSGPQQTVYQSKVGI